MYNTLLDTNARDSLALCIFLQVFVRTTEFSVTFCITHLFYISPFYHNFYGCVHHKQERAARGGQ